MASGRPSQAMLLVLVFLSASLSGCFSNNDGDDVVYEDSLSITPDPLTAGIFQTVNFEADDDMRVLVPYLILQPSTGYVQNGTVLDLQEGEEVEIIVLIPPRIDSFVVLVGEPGREYFPIRDGNISWSTWIENGMLSSKGVKITESEFEGGLLQLSNSSETGGSVSAKIASIIRPMSASVSVENGGLHSTGIVSGFETFNMLSVLSDETVDPFDACDGAKGYLNRWAGMGSPGYECGADFLVAEFTEYGYDNVERHRFQYIEGNPEAYNICAYKEGYEYPDEWMVIGAHFDIAPIVAPTPVDMGAPRGYGTRVGAYDNTVGTSVVLNMAEAMFDIPTRRGIVFCLWSSEEGGKRGSIAWVDDIPDDITISNYINIDMGGVNWPGNGTPSDRVGPDGGGSYPASQENWPFRVYIGPDTEEDVINQPKMVYLAEWLAGDALGIEEQLAVLNGELNAAWVAAGEPGVIINEATTARSDHASFQAIDTVTVGFGGLVDGYDCYHQTCDTIDEMLYWMENDYASGMQNLINSIDLMTWYGTMIFLHLDHQPILNSYL
ncbi:MAG: Zn-dependent exopeptidase M28 [Candidatus Poseidoniales archaeon]|nr:MAG: Zn-dependent exopeptidase M28 [Candidatus Poseidoniales archaeon]